MSKIPYNGISSPSSFDYQVVRTVNGNLTWGDNVASTSPLSVQTPSTPNQEFTINHNLGYIPSGFLILSKDQYCDVMSSRINLWTKSQIFLKCNTASVNLVLVVSE